MSSAHNLRAFLGHQEVSLCRYLLFCLSLSFFPYNRTDFGQYISARIKLRVPILVAQKVPKTEKNLTFLVFSFLPLYCAYFSLFMVRR